MKSATTKKIGARVGRKFGFQDEATLWIFKFLETNWNLKDLQIRDIFLSQEGWKTVVASLGRNQHLSLLRMRTETPTPTEGDGSNNANEMTNQCTNHSRATKES
jgi:hypothetical protein